MSVVVAPDKVVTLTYILTDEEGRVLEERTVENPVVYIHGRDQILQSLERVLEGQTPGFATIVSVDPANGFGEFKQDLVMEMEKSQFPTDVVLKTGMNFNTIGPIGLPAVIRVIEVREDVVVVDGNHPLAGINLIFDCRILGVRDASERELENGLVEPTSERSDLH